MEAQRKAAATLTSLRRALAESKSGSAGLSLLSFLAVLLSSLPVAQLSKAFLVLLLSVAGAVVQRLQLRSRNALSEHSTETLTLETADGQRLEVRLPPREPLCVR